MIFEGGISMINNLGEKLKSARISRELTRNQIAERVGVTASVIEHYETGERVPSVPVLLKLATHYRVSLDYLLGHSVDSNNTLSLDGLTEKQVQALKQTVDYFRNLPNKKFCCRNLPPKNPKWRHL